jgi:hypothetical protein
LGCDRAAGHTTVVQQFIVGHGEGFVLLQHAARLRSALCGGVDEALVIEQRKHDATAAAVRACHAEPRAFPQKTGVRS